MFDTRQEHLDHEAGCASELENAYTTDKREAQMTDQRKEAAALVAAGWFVVFGELEVCGRITDAVIGTSYVIYDKARTYQEALNLCGGEECHERHIMQPKEHIK